MEGLSSTVDRQGSHAADPLHWLVALCERLVSAFEIVNANGESILPPLAGDTPTRLRRAVTQPQSTEIRAVLDAASRHSSVVFAELEGLRLAAIDLRSAVAEKLTLVLAERQGAPQRSSRPDEMARIGRWLAKAIRRQGAPSGTASRDWHELYLLHRILADAAARGSDVAVVQTLVDALAIWVDTDTRAYASTRTGEFVLEIGLAGAELGLTPRVIDARSLPSVVGPHRLDRLQAERLGFQPNVDVILEAVEDAGSTPWLLVHLGTFSPHDVERLALFSELLLPAVHAARAVEVSRLVWSLTHELAGHRLSASDAAAAALHVLGHATMSTATLTVRRVDGARIVDLGDPLPAHRHAKATPGAGLRLALDLSAPFQAVLALCRDDDRPFTVREQRLAEAGASVLASWLSTALGRGELREDRTPGEAIDASLDRRQRHEPPRHDDVSLLVIRPEAVQSTGELRDLWVGRIRRRLRPSDVTGALPTGEIGVLLPETGTAEAHVVVARLQRIFEDDYSLYLLERAPIGVATSRATMSDALPTLLDQARQGTQADASGLNDFRNV